MLIHCDGCCGWVPMVPPAGAALPKLSCPRCQKEMRNARQAFPQFALRVLEGPAYSGQVFGLDQTQTLGRDSQSGIHLFDNQVSRFHARLEVTPKGCRLEDLGSTNGTYLNGVRFQGITGLHPGDTIRVGAFQFLFSGPGPRRNHEAPVRENATRFKPGGQKGLPPKPLLLPGPPIDCGFDSHGTGAKEPSPGHDSICVAEMDARLNSLVPQRAETADFEKLRKEYDKLLAAFRISEDVRDLDQMEKILDRVVDTMFELFPARRVAIFLARESHGMDLAVIRERDGDSRRPTSISRTLVERALAQNKSILTRDALQNVGTRSVIVSSVNSAMTIPLISSDGTAGVLHVESTTGGSPQPFTRRDLEIATGIGAQIAMAIHRVRLASKVQKELAIRDRLGRYLPPHVLDRVVNDERFVKPGGHLKRATILFSDIRGFTHLSENLEPGEVVELLNEYFELMVDIVFRHGGTLDKFIGDAVMAFWGGPNDEETAASNAVLAAIDMQRTIEQLNLRRIGRNEDPISVGIGVNTGDVLVGNIGSSRRLEFTVIGDPVNVASRLCSIAVGGEILVSDQTRNTIGDRVRSVSLPPTRLKGKQGEIVPHRVVGVLDSADDSSTMPRKARRLRLVRPVTLHRVRDGENFLAQLENASPGGCAIQAATTGGSFHLGEEVCLDFETPRGFQMEKIAGKIVHVGHGKDVKSNLYHEVRVQFSGLTLDQGLALQSMVSEGP